MLTHEIQGSLQENRIVPIGSTVQGEGFSVRVPDSGLYVVKDTPRPGFLSLRNPENYFLPGSYNVFPFTLESSPPTLKAAWQAHIAKETSSRFIKEYRILSEWTNDWNGSPAWFHVGFVPSEIVTANCVIRYDNKYYLIVRSEPILSDRQNVIDRQISDVKRNLINFLKGIQFNTSSTNIIKG